MPIQDSDLLLIEDTSGVSKKITASKLKENLAADTYLNYKLLVNKPDYSSRFVYAQNMQQSVAPTDYMLVERSGVSYKVNGQQIIDYFPTVPAGAAGAIVDVENTAIDGAWTFTQPYTEARWEGITFGLGMFVAVSRYYGQVWTSSDNGATWTKRYELPNAEWRSVTFGNGRFVAVSDGADTVKAIYSDDGVTWSAASNQLNQPWQSVAYGNGRYVAVGHSTGRSMYSTDGSSWTIGYMDSQYWTRVAYGGDKFVAVNNTNGKYIAYSTDGASWTEVIFDPAEVYRWTSLAYGNGEFIANTEGGNTTIMRSSDGVNWSLRDMGINNAGRSGTFGGGKFVFAYGSKVVYSTNAAATTWAETTVEGGTYQDIAYGNGYFVAVDQGAGLISRSYGGAGQMVLESTLTLAAEDNLELFTTGDAIRMVNEDGDVASYTPVTSAITNVGFVPYWNTSRNWTNSMSGFSAPQKAFNGVDDEGASAGGVGTLNLSSSPLSYSNKVEVYANSSYQVSINLNNGQAVYANNSGWTTVVEGSGTINTLEFSDPFFTAIIEGIRVDGLLLVDSGTTGDPGSGNILTFASPNNDLKYFQDQEFLAGVSVTGSTVGTYKDGVGVTDPNILITVSSLKLSGERIAGDQYLGFSSSTDDSSIMTFPTPLTSSSNIWVHAFKDNNGGELYVNVGYPDETLVTVSGNSVWYPFDTGRSTIYNFQYRAGAGTPASYSGLQYFSTNNDVTGKFTTENNTVVVSTDLANNQMVVNNGTWAVNGTVTGEPRSGTGNFDGNTGVVIGVSNSNQQWIGADNRLGEAFYIKPASTVNGLATARSLAEANALSWSSSESYLEGDWVIYGGYYWRAMEYNINVAPSSANFEEWLGFGPI